MRLIILVFLLEIHGDAEIGHARDVVNRLALAGEGPVEVASRVSIFLPLGGGGNVAIVPRKDILAGEEIAHLKEGP